MSVKLKRVNNEVVRPVRVEIPDENLPIKGASLCPELYANVFLCAKKNSGKTSVISKMLNGCATKDTTVIVFASTVFKDPIYTEIYKRLTANGIHMERYTSLKEDGIDILDTLVKKLEEESRRETLAKEDDEEDDEEGNPLVFFDSENEEDDSTQEPAQRSRTKFRAPRYIFVFDDLSNELKSPSLLSLLKKNRHFHSRIIVSSQYPLDLLPESRKQIDLWLVFRGQPKDKLETIYKDADLSIPFPLFHKIYNYATKEPYSFLFINTRNDELRQNFSKKFILG